MQGASVVRPIRDNILVERLSGHGVERVTKGGIVIPATNEAKVRTKNDYFRARVKAVGPEVRELEPGEDVLVYAWAENGQGRGLYTGKAIGARQLMIKPGDVVCAVAPDADVEAVNSDVR